MTKRDFIKFCRALFATLLTGIVVWFLGKLGVHLSTIPGQQP